MLPPQESKNCRELLQHLPEADVLSLCETVCNRLVVPTSLREAIEVIIQYSKSSEELIGRKKVKADVLLRYLLSVGVDISAKSTKTELVSKTLDLWRGSPTAATSYPIQPGSAPIEVIHTEINNYTVIHNQEDNGQKLAIDFVNWFYPMLRSLHAMMDYTNFSVSTETTERWGPQHFWPSSTLAFHVSTQTGNVHQEICEGPESVSNKIASLVLQERVMLNPNSTVEGCRGVLSPHGLGKVAVLGTMHKYGVGESGDVVGIFEQMFELIRDINDGNNYKIKRCELRILVGDQRQCGQQLSLTKDAVKFLEN